MRPICLPLLCLLAACEAPEHSRLAGLGRGAEDLARTVLFLPPRQDGVPPARYDPPVGTLAEAGPGSTAGPTLLVTLGRAGRRLGLIQAQGEQRLWRSDDGLVVATDGARVVATAGTTTNLAATRFDSPDPLDDVTRLMERPAAARRLVDLAPATRDPMRMRFGVALECRLRASPVAEGLYVEERCGGGARFVNRYWADPETGAVWRSEQWVGMDERPMVIEVITPPAN